jgi:hypothetical protein
MNQMITGPKHHRPAPTRYPEEVNLALSQGRDSDAEGAIATLVALAEKLGDTESERLARSLLGLREEFTAFYYRWILVVEAAEARAALSSQLPRGGNYRDIANAEGAAIYDRVIDLFQHARFQDCRRFVLVGAGELPITALHVHDRTDVPHIECIDVRPNAAERVNDFSHWLGTNRLHGVCRDGLLHDYSHADIVYVANMVASKADVLARILQTAPANVQIILRDPYSFGLLWADEGAATLDPRLEIYARGRGSRFLSRDLFLRRAGLQSGGPV